MLIDETQAKNCIIFDVMKIMIHLAWVANSMVIFSASYNEDVHEHLLSYYASASCSV